jgi:hypothetical protein
MKLRLDILQLRISIRLRRRHTKAFYHCASVFFRNYVLKEVHLLYCLVSFFFFLFLFIILLLHDSTYIRK